MAETAVEEAIQFAESSPNPDPATLSDYVYVE
jgi:TPP-dependent pyruvate/acetoin dehydrogenase alpha subunit